ncbi:MAG: DJ-1/PfpI family protein [Opitutaceae bacterium]|nr:DJ-1/PfpI family protein [Opitutaceae bacterium]
MQRVLMLLAEGFEEIEMTAPLDLLRRAGVEVVSASIGEHFHVTGRCGLTVHADTTLAALQTDTSFDLLLLPGGPGVKLLRSDPRVRARVIAQNAAGKWIAAICAAPTVLNDATLLSGRRYTAHHSVAGELPAILEGERVVVDGNLVTSRGAGTALDFGLKLVELLVSPAKSREISDSIHA